MLNPSCFWLKFHSGSIVVKDTKCEIIFFFKAQVIGCFNFLSNLIVTPICPKWYKS